MNLAKHDAETDMEMDMTPMIDVVFLLIIFFMVITDLTQQELEDVSLPVSTTAAPDKPNPDDWRPIVNVNHWGKMVYKRVAYYDPETDVGPTKYTRLRGMLFDFATQMKRMQADKGEPTQYPDDALLIRADTSTPFRFVQHVMEQCSQPDIQIWKLEMAVATPEE